MSFLREVKVRKLGVFRDGGTVHYVDMNTNESYYVDGRIGTQTPGVIYDKYPNRPGAKQISVKLKVVSDDFKNEATIA